MGFINPWLLLGTLGVAVPIIIHLLNRFRHRQIEWGAMELLRKAMVVRSRQVQIEDLILLATRCLAVLLLALAIARPTIKSSAAWMGGQSDAGLVIAIDGSYSMNYRGQMESRFEQAIGKAREVLKTVKPGDPVSIVLMGNKPRILMQNIGYKEDDFDQVLRRIAPLAEGLNVEANLERVAGLMLEAKSASKECFIITDAQEMSWGRLSDKARQCITDASATGNVFILPASSGDKHDNLAMTRFELKSGAKRRGSTACYEVEVANFGPMARKAIPVRLFVDDQPRDQSVIEEIGPGETKTIQLYLTFKDTGTFRLRAALDTDELATDNERFATVHVSPQVKVLIVETNPSLQPGSSITWAMMKVFYRTGQEREGLAIKAIPSSELATARLGDYDVVVLANAELRDEVKEVHDYLVAGGNVLIVPGPNNRSAEVFNARMVWNDVPLAPAKLAGFVQAGDRGTPWPFDSVGGEHAISQAVGRLPERALQDTRFFAYFSVEPFTGSRTVLRIANDSAPLLVERSVGAGKVLMLTSSPDLQWSDMIRHFPWPVMMDAALTYMTTQAYEKGLTVGQSLLSAVPAGAGQAKLIFRDPAGKELVFQANRSGSKSVADGSSPEAEATETIGFYQASANEGAPDTNAPQMKIVAAVNLDAGSESNVKMLSEAGLKESLGGLPVKLLSGDENDVATSITEARVGKELWRHLVALGLLVLLIEAALAFLFSRRANRSQTTQSTTAADLLSSKAA